MLTSNLAGGWKMHAYISS